MSSLTDRLREAQLDTNLILGEIKEIAQELQGSWHSLSRNQVDALKVRADIQFKLLNKVLPDLRAVEQINEPTAPVKFIIRTAKSDEITVQ